MLVCEPEFPKFLSSVLCEPHKVPDEDSCQRSLTCEAVRAASFLPSSRTSLLPLAKVILALQQTESHPKCFPSNQNQRKQGLLTMRICEMLAQARAKKVLDGLPEPEQEMPVASHAGSEPVKCGRKKHL